MIQIDNLTAYQVEMLDHMWSLDSQEEFFDWYNSLDDEDQQLADTLQRLIILAAMDELIEETEYKEASKVLEKFRL